MKRIIVLALVCLSTFCITNAQNNIIINDNIRLPKDTIISSRLVADINAFLQILHQSGVENPYILPAEKSETQIQSDEIREMLNNPQDSSLIIRPHLLGIEPLTDKKSYQAQIAYIAQNNEQPILKACFDFIASPGTDGRFLFSSPLKRRTREWMKKENAHYTFYYQKVGVEKLIDQYLNYLIDFDEKLNFSLPTDYYFCDDCETMTQVLQMAGIRYLATYNSFSWFNIFFTTDDKIIVISSQRASRQEVLDGHDLFHFRAEALAKESANTQIICGASYTLAGSWGLTWEEIQRKFKSRITYDENTDWLKLYYERHNFGDSEREHLLLRNFINALIVQDVAKRHGFQAAIPLFSSGSIQNRETFFDTLDIVTGIKEQNFNDRVGRLIDQAMEKIN